MNKNELISVVVLNHNGKNFLFKCLNSLVKNTYPNFEIILVDNASEDRSVEFVKKKFPKVKIAQNKIGLGFAGGNNTGIKKAKGDYILLISNDTWVENKFIKNIVEYYKNNNYDVVAPYQKDYKNERNFYSYTNTVDLLGHPILKPNQEPSFYLNGVCLFFSKKLYFETKGLDDNFFMYFEDTDWFWRLNLLNKKFSYIKDLFIYHYGAGSTGGGINYFGFLWRNQNTLQMLLKNYKCFNLLWVLPIYFIQNIFEMIFFLIILKLKIACSYLEGWTFNIKNFSRTMKERKWVQKNRLVSDWTIMKKMYFGFGKAHHLINFYIKKE